MTEYRRPSHFARIILNTPILLAAKLGISLAGANSLTVRGIATGQERTVPVNPLAFNGANYLVAPRGNTHWARNLRAAGEARLTLGRKRQHIRAVELTDAEKPAVIAAYLDRWGNVTRSHFGASTNPGPEELARLAARTPVFRYSA